MASVASFRSGVSVWVGFAISFAVVLLMLTGLGTAAEPQATWATGAEFHRLLDRPLLANRGMTPLRQILERLSEERRIAIVLDRRIDPGWLVPVDIQAPFFDQGIAELVRDLPAVPVAVADTLFVTTPETARTLRTRIILCEQMLDTQLKDDFGRKLDLTRRTTLKWPQVTSPREILTSIANRYEITISNPDAIPHDLWAAGTLAGPNATEALTFVAIQYGLEPDWQSPDEVRLVPALPEPRLKREHRLRGQSKAELAAIQAQFPQREIEISGRQLVLTGLLEEHEQIDVLLGNRAARMPTEAPSSLGNRRFTLRMTNHAFSELLNVLDKQGIPVRWDAQQIAQAGIDLNQDISLELEDATIQTLLRSACDPLGLDFRIQGNTVELLPKQK